MSRFWNPLTERLAEERLRTIQLRRFKEQLAYAKQNSPFFREKFKG